MLALTIVAAVLILIAFLRFGVIVQYSEDGFLLWAKAGFLKFRLLNDDKEKKPKKKKKEKKEKDSKGYKPGSLSEFMTIIKAAVNALSRLRRRLLIKQLILYYTSAGEDPANTALMFGAANAVFATVIPLLENCFRIKHRDLKAAADFDAKEQRIYAKISISIAVWEVFYILFALFPIIKILFKNRPKSNKKDRKDGQANGKSPDQ